MECSRTEIVLSTESYCTIIKKSKKITIQHSIFVPPRWIGFVKCIIDIESDKPFVFVFPHIFKNNKRPAREKCATVT